MLAVHFPGALPLRVWNRGRPMMRGLVALMVLCSFVLSPAGAQSWWDDDNWDWTDDDYYEDVRSGYGSPSRPQQPSYRQPTAPSYSGSSSGSNVPARVNSNHEMPSNIRPWSGAWYPRKYAELAFRDFSQGLSPFEKYDSIVYNWYGRVPGAAAWEADPLHNHNNAPYPEKPSWTGHCNGLAAAAILCQEPTRSIRIPLDAPVRLAKLIYNNARSAPAGLFEDGRHDYTYENSNRRDLELTVADQKGWLAESYMTCQTQQFSNKDLLGHRYSGSEINVNDPTYRDIEPHYFHYLLQEYVRRRNQAVVAEVDPHQPVNNHPVYGYEAQGSYDPRRRAYNFRTSVLMTDYASSADATGTKTMKRDYTYTLYCDQSGRIVGGEWTGSSVTKHPDFIWIPIANAQAYQTYENPCINGGFVNFLFQQYGGRRESR